MQLFPADFEGVNVSSSDPNFEFHSNSILFAMDIADLQIGRLCKIANKANLDVWVVSSMGQNAINRGAYVPEPFLNDWRQLIRGLQLKVSDYQFRPAMQPDICFECVDKVSLNVLRLALSGLQDSSGTPIFVERYAPVRNTLNISMRASAVLASDCLINHAGSMMPMSKFGVTTISRDIGTGYHVPEGILLAHGVRSAVLLADVSSPVDTSSIAALISAFYGLPT